MTVFFQIKKSSFPGIAAAATALSFLLLAGAGAASGAEHGAHLEKVVVVMRHGVRAPTKPAQWLSQYSRDPWYAWPVAPGILTKHGADGAEAMGGKLRAFYAAKGFLTENPCANKASVYVWADSEDSRTRESGSAAARGLVGQCASPAHFKMPAGSPDPVFTHEENAALKLDPAVAEKSLMADAGGDLNRLGPEYDRALKAMLDIVYPGLTAAECRGKAALKACVFVTGKNSFKADDWKIQVSGPLKTGSSFAENLLLEYAQRHPKSAIGWGRATRGADIAAIMPLHNIYTKLTRQNAYYAARRGAVLTSEIADLISERKPQAAGAAPVPEQAKFVLFLGHDSNLSNLMGIFDLSWKLPGEPDLTAPNTALAFERWRAADGTAFVRLRLFSQSLAELRVPGTSARGSVQTVKIPECKRDKNGACTVKKFAGFAYSRINPSVSAKKVP